MIIALTGDLHFDDYYAVSRGAVGGVTSRLRDIRAACSWLAKDAVDRGAEELVFLGDYFEQRDEIPVTALHEGAKAMGEFSAAFSRVHLLVGNHDCALQDASIHSLSAFAADNVITYTVPTVAEIGGVCFGFVPWAHDPESIVSGVDYVREEGAEILLTHVQVAGMYPNKKEAGEVPVESLRLHDFVLTLSGHIHTACTMDENYDHAMYIGSLLSHTFKDANLPMHRAYWLYDTETGEMESVANDFSPRFYIVSHPSEVKDVRDIDYVRVKHAAKALEPEAVGEMESLRETGVWVEGVVKPDESVTPRVALDEDDDDVDVLSAYVDYRGVEGKERDRLVEAGLALLHDAREVE